MNKILFLKIHTHLFLKKKLGSFKLLYNVENCCFKRKGNQNDVFLSAVANRKLTTIFKIIQTELFSKKVSFFSF